MRIFCKKESAPYPKVEFSDTHFYITFRQNREYLKVATIEKTGDIEAKEKIKDTLEDTLKDTLKLLSENERIIIEAMLRNPKITAEAIAELLNINIRNTKKHLARLKEKGIIERIGSRKSGSWQIIK